MNLDFALILILLTLVAAVLWVLENFWLRPRRRGKEASGALGKTTETLRSLFPVLLLVLVFRSFLFEPFKIPSGSMIPTLWIGDFIVVNKFSYGLRLPVLNKKILSTGAPGRGDAIVVRYPGDERVSSSQRASA